LLSYPRESLIDNGYYDWYVSPLTGNSGIGELKLTTPLPLMEEKGRQRK
jgi:hypothetical protein